MLINLKCEIQELFGGGKIDIDFNKINIYVGQNGTGKTVLLKLAWFGTYITSNKILEERGFLPQNSIQEDFVNHTISKVFDEVDLYKLLDVILLEDKFKINPKKTKGKNL